MPVNTLPTLARSVPFQMAEGDVDISPAESMTAYSNPPLTMSVGLEIGLNSVISLCVNTLPLAVTSTAGGPGQPLLEFTRHRKLVPSKRIVPNPEDVANGAPSTQVAPVSVERSAAKVSSDK